MVVERTLLPDETWTKLGWKAPYGFHPNSLDLIRMESEQNGGMLALLGCRVDETGVACGYCHNCGAKLAFPDDRSCQKCGSSDADE